MKMPSLKALYSHRASTPSHLFVADGRSAVWARSNTDDVSISQLHKFWSGLSPAARRELLRIDKQALFEQVRKNLYCSRCHGLLVEGYAQIVSYGRNLQAGLRGYSNGSAACSKHISEVGATGANASLQDDTKDPSVHPWGGLAATRDSMLTVLDCFLDGTPLEVFESARARERERELLYPDACGGGGRGWISQSSGSFGSNGRGHGMKDTCALHTARLSCEALVDFWSALGEETRRSLLRMKEEDFIERLMFRFDSKRFCRDCRRNVLREFKEMKELKRTRKEPRCTRWFCTADTVFRYEVSDSVLQVDWRDSFAGDGGSTYQHFEWALGTAEGKADILGFEDVGLSESIHVEGLDLANTAACYIMVRGYKRDGRFTELSARAHALKGQLCVHRRLIVGDGYVSITKGESIQRFFERAEETEEEEDEDSMDKDGNELEGEGSRPQKHAKSPELARDFLLDAATVIFKEQVEKAFREGTARQNAHSIFVCLALNLLEERVRVACKEITTLEKQNKLLEEEEDEKREEEERRERRKLKEKEKKLRRKEKLKGKERDKEKSKGLVNSSKTTPNGSVSGISIDTEDMEPGVADQEEDSRSDIDSVSARPPSPDMAQARSSDDGLDRKNGTGNGLDLSFAHEIEDTLSTRDGNGAFIVERTKSSKRRSQSRQADGSQSGQPRREILDSRVGARTFAKVAQSSVVEQFFVQDKGTGSHEVHSQSNGHSHESDNIPKRVDAWHRGNGHVQTKLEDFQHCACGGPQTTNLRVKGGHRSIARVVSNKDVPSSRAGERVDYSIRGVPSSVTHDFGYSQDKQDGSKCKISVVPTTKRKGDREQERMDSSLGEMVRHGLSRSSSVGELSECTQNGGHGPSNSNPWHPVENVASSRPTEIENSSNSTGVPVSQIAISTDRTDSHGNSKGISAKPTGRAKPFAAPATPAATSAAAVVHGKPGVLPLPTGISDSRPAIQVVDQNSGSWYPSGGQSAASVVVGATTSSTASVTAKPHIAGIGDSPTQSVLGSASDSGSSSMRTRDQGLNLSEQPKVVLENLDTGGGGGGGAGAEVVGHGRNTSPSLIGEIPGHQSADAGLSQSAAVVGSQQPAPMGSQTTGLKVAQVSAAKEMMAPSGPVRPVQMPTMMPAPPVHMHHPPSNFGFYQWGGAGRPRNGVLPLPQTGGFLVPGLNSLGLPMGCLPPMSLPQSGPQGLGLGRLPVLPNGLNPFQLRDPVFLSRYTTGPSPGNEGDGKRPTLPPKDHVNPMTPGDEFTSGIQTRDGLSAPQEAEVVSAGSNVSALPKEIVNESSPDTTGFSLFHFSGPEAVAQKELDSSVVPPLKESTADNAIETFPDVSKCAALNDFTSGAPDSSTTAGEYSLFATAGKGLVFF